MFLRCRLGLLPSLYHDLACQPQTAVPNSRPLVLRPLYHPLIQLETLKRHWLGSMMPFFLVLGPERMCGVDSLYLVFRVVVVAMMQ